METPDCLLNSLADSFSVSGELFNQLIYHALRLIASYFPYLAKRAVSDYSKKIDSPKSYIYNSFFYRLQIYRACTSNVADLSGYLVNLRQIDEHHALS